MSTGQRREAHVVVDLGFGDAGKGAVTDHLVRARGAHAVLRFNGGAQAGHNVVTDDGRHHTFAQFGAGTFVPGVRTHLTRHVVFHPTALLAEARHLERAGVADPLARVTVSAGAPVVTPFHQAATRLRELARGDARHGSCGVGVGEVMLDLTALGDAVRAGDLADVTSLRRRLARVQERKRAELDAESRALRGSEAAAGELRVLESPDVAGLWLDALAPLLARDLVTGDERVGELLAAGPVVFEGAQGVLLDEWRGFHPHTTWSTCTFDNALETLREHGYDAPVTRLGVLRTYATRHGAGPFPTEDGALTASLAEPHNPAGAWQGAFRAGWLDAPLARYALAACGGVDGLALTHLDRLAAHPRWKSCRGYRLPDAVPRELFEWRDGVATAPRLGPARDLAWQSSLARALFAAEPLLDEVALIDPERYVDLVEGALGVRVTLTSAGPTASAKRARG